MKKLKNLIVLLLFTTTLYARPEATIDRDFMVQDGLLRYYRVALPITATCYNQSFNGNTDEVYDFWDNAESFINQLFIPLGICVEIQRSNKLILSSPNAIDRNPIEAPSWGTELLNEIIGADAYDIGLWISEPADWDNSGVSILGGAYNPTTKAGGYSQKNVITVAHELGHLFGAVHTHDTGSMTEPGMGQSVMGYGSPSDFFSLASIKAIFAMNQQRNAAYFSDVERTLLVGNNQGGNYVYAVRQEQNNAPSIELSEIENNYKIPEGSCFEVNFKATDADGDRLTYAFQQYEDGAIFHAYGPSESSTIDFRPQYTLFPYDDYLFINDGTDVPSMYPGSYHFAIAVNDLPQHDCMNYGSLMKKPFVSKYSVTHTNIEIVAGELFRATLIPNKTHYSAGEEVTINWGINTSLFNADTRLRISLSDNFGQTFDYTLAEDVPALLGEFTFTLPLLSFDNIDYQFGAEERSVRPGIIRIDIEDNIAYTLTCLHPDDEGAAGGFTMSGGIPSYIDLPRTNCNNTNMLYHLNGKIISSHNNQLPSRIYICNGKKILRHSK